jgi:bacillithiol system protein YtxJ
MEWKDLNNIEQLAAIKKESENQPVLLFKHSTRCSISDIAWKRIKDATLPSNAIYYYLDLLSHRNISNEIAEVFKVHHESPQALLIKNNECVYAESHLAITVDDLTEQIGNN